MSKKKPEPIRQHQNLPEYPPGTVVNEYLGGDREVIYADGHADFIDAQGKSLAKVPITDEQLEAWKTAPRDQALKEALKLFREQNMDVSEARVKLEVLKFISELQGATLPMRPKGMNVVSIRVKIAGSSEKQTRKLDQKDAIDVEAITYGNS